MKISPANARQHASTAWRGASGGARRQVGKKSGIRCISFGVRMRRFLLLSNGEYYDQRDAENDRRGRARVAHIDRKLACLWRKAAVSMA